jgi:proline dehydrogenase
MPGVTERLLYRVAKRWIAGYNLEDAIIDARHANEKKMAAIVNRLGEHTPDRKLIEEYVGEYFRLLDRMHETNVIGAISVKPSQLGLTAEPSLFSQNLSRIIDKARDMKRSVWVDMENSPYTDNTIQVYREHFDSYKELGLCLQANLRRTRSDLENLLRIGAMIRLVKGAYPESADVAFKKKSEVDQNYLDLLRILFENGSRFVVGTHDDKLIAQAKVLNKEHPVDFEFEFLKGIRDDVKEKLVGEGYRVGEYIPYGPEWYNYSKRRLRERKRNILLLLRSMTG